MLYHFYPIEMPKIWGAEHWLLSAVSGYDSVCVDTGQRVSALLDTQRERLVGKHVYARFGDTFPLLFKFIDADADLSVQVHPSDAIAKKYGLPFGKTEMWYVMPSSADARLYCGLKSPLTPDAYKQMVADKTITDALAEYDVKEGDCFYIPAGRIHAIRSGCRICEIQQTSDTTYRIYDYDRVDSEGLPRELHTEHAAECIDYNVQDDYRVYYQQRDNEPVNLIRCSYFTTNVLNITEPVVRDYTDLDSFVVLVCLDGEGTITTEDGTTVLRKGELLLRPAADKGSVELSGALRVLEVYIE